MIKLKNIAIPMMFFCIVFNVCEAGAFPVINAGVSVEYIKDVDENSIYKSPINFVDIPKINYSDLGYFFRFKPLNMLSSGELVLKKYTEKKNFALNQTVSIPSVYNISFAKGGEADFQSNTPNIEELIKKHPNRPEYIYAYAIKLRDEKKYDAAIFQIDRALNLDNEYALGHFLKGDILRMMGKFKEASKEYLITIGINPYCTDAYFNIAKMLEVFGKNELALNYYEMAYAVSPNDLEIRNQILKLNRKIYGTERRYGVNVAMN